MTNRRNFLGLAAGALAAGPQLAGQIANQASTFGGGLAQPLGFSDDAMETDGVMLTTKSYHMVDFAAQAARITGDPTLLALFRQMVAEGINMSNNSQYWDADIIENKSMSLGAKRRLQRDRLIDKEVACRLGGYTKEHPWQLLKKMGIGL